MREKREMTALKFLKEWNRMCNAANDCVNDCPLSAAFECGRYCDVDAKRNPKEVIAIVQKWAEENPAKTVMEDFFEKFPNALKKDTGEPFGCPYYYRYTDDRSCMGSCLECWSIPLEVEP